jgi:hypothetical protein
VNREEFERLRREIIAESVMTDQFAEIAELRTTALEEIVFARSPRSILVRHRLRKDLRESVQHYGWAGPDFLSRRIQAIGDGWLRPLSATGRHRNRGQS